MNLLGETLGFGALVGSFWIEILLYQDLFAYLKLKVDHLNVVLVKKFVFICNIMFHLLNFILLKVILLLLDCHLKVKKKLGILWDLFEK